MRVITTIDTVNVSPEPTKSWLQKFILSYRRLYEQMANVINGRISFGDGEDADNIDGVWANETAPAAPNTDFTVTHNMGRVPVGYLVTQSDRAVLVYDGSVPATTTEITLRADVADAVIRLFIF